MSSNVQLQKSIKRDFSSLPRQAIDGGGPSLMTCLRNPKTSADTEKAMAGRVCHPSDCKNREKEFPIPETKTECVAWKALLRGADQRQRGCNLLRGPD